MITHNEAEILISSRQDAPLDPAVERALQAHLATCDQCRAFAIATERLTAGLRALPSVPLGPNVQRDVLQHIAASGNPVVRLMRSAPTGPVFASAAAIVIVLLVGVLAFGNLFESNTSPDGSQLAAVPTHSVPVPTQPAASMAKPTSTSEATSTQQPTPEPTSTTVTTEQPVAGESIVDLTESIEPTPSPTATQVPTPKPEKRVAVEPTPKPTEVVTVQIIPTATLVPTQAPTPKPQPTATVAPSPTNTPLIEPLDADDQPGVAVDTEPTSPPLIEGSPGSSQIMSLTQTGTPDAGSGSATSERRSLADVSERYTGIEGDPAGHLGLTPQGRLEFMDVPDGASLTTDEGYVLRMADLQPGVITLCGDGFCDSSVETPEDPSWEGDQPLGIIGNTAYWLRSYGDRTEVMAGATSGTQVLDASIISTLGAVGGLYSVYESDGTLFAWLSSNQWLEVSGSRVDLHSGGYSNPTNVRFAPVAAQGPLMGYISNGTLVIAPMSAPDNAILTLPSDGSDFDIAPKGDRVAMIRGSNIVIFDMNGNELAVYEGGEMMPGSVIWLKGGLIFVDRMTDALWQIPETGTSE